MLRRIVPRSHEIVHLLLEMFAFKKKRGSFSKVNLSENGLAS